MVAMVANSSPYTITVASGVAHRNQYDISGQQSYYGCSHNQAKYMP